MNASPNTDELESMTTTAAHVFTLAQLLWIRSEAKRQKKSMSEVVRDAINAARERSGKEATAA